MLRRKIGIAVSLALFISSLWILAGQAQEQSGWSSPIRLSEQGSEASEAFMVSDPYGYVHAFWTETTSSGDDPAIMYARFDGENWTEPVDIFVVQPGGYTIGYVSPFVDHKGVLHLVWTGGNNGPAYYSHAPAVDALSARNWSPPIYIDIPAFRLKLLVDAEEDAHILYSNFYGENPGIFYTRSEDGGLTWSGSTWLDPDIPDSHAPQDMKFVMDDTGGFHAAWTYLDLQAGITDMVRYAHSLDDRDSWSSPFTVDEADESNDELRKTNVGLVVQGQTVHVIWAGTENTNREHRFSIDGGLSWSKPSRIFGSLHGEAIGDGVAVDAAGRVHFVGTIRWPQAIWHAYWERDRWVEPSIAYLIARDDVDNKSPMNDSIRAHYVRLAVRSGSQLVMTFTNSPEDRPYALYTMYHTLIDVSPVEPMPTPVLNSPSQIKPALPESPLPQIAAPTPVAVDPSLMDNPPETNAESSLDRLLLGIYPSLALVLLAIVVQRLRSR